MKRISMTFLFVVAAVILGLPMQSSAWHGGWGWSFRPWWGIRIAYVPIWVGGVRYYYYDGDYYYPDGPNYVAVAPPVGAVVSTIPDNYTPVTINGVTYFTNGDVYYLRTGNAFEVVARPTPVAKTAAQVPQTSAPATADTDESFTVNIPNVKGGYTPVLLKRSGDGFVGPQGEFYPQFPKVSQLKAMYGK